MSCENLSLRALVEITFNLISRPPRRHARHTRKGNIFTSITQLRRNEFRHETISRGARREERQRTPAPDAEAVAPSESGADELFVDEDCTQPCTVADLVHGAVVYARHNAAEGEEGGDAMADEEGG